MDAAEKVYDILTNDDEARLCRDIPEAACREQPENFTLHIGSLSLTKTGDGLMDPKLILSWLLGAIGAPASLIGLLVPVRESLALLPQLFVSARIRELPVRKWVWAGGSVAQGLCVIGMALACWRLEGFTGGVVVVGLLAAFALARSLCSVSYKDVLGKTVAKKKRGTATGTASTIAAAAVLAYGLALGSGLIPLTVDNLCIGLAVGGVCWFLAAVAFSRLAEEKGAMEGGESLFGRTFSQFALLREDPQLVRFITVRALLISTALAPPYFVTLAGRSGQGNLESLGFFVVASSLAALVSTFAWGRLADRSSRFVLIASALIAAVFLGAAGAVGFFYSEATSTPFLLPALLFGLMISYQGVRLGRSTHLVDMADEERRAAYTALSNTIIGVLLLVGGAFGLLAEVIGTAAVLLIFAGLCVLAAIGGWGLEEVQG